MTAISEELLRRFETKESWLVHKSELHGVAHMTRVFLLQEIICEQLEQDGIAINREAVRFTAMAHDVGRLNDNSDSKPRDRFNDWMGDFARAAYAFDTFTDFTKDHKDGNVGVEPSPGAVRKLGGFALGELGSFTRKTPAAVYPTLIYCIADKVAEKIRQPNTWLRQFGL